MKSWVLLGLALCTPVAIAQTTLGTAQSTAFVGLNQQLFLQLLIQRSVEVQYSQMNTDVSRHLKKAEAGLYETVSFMSVRSEARLRQRTALERSQSLSATGVPNLDENANIAEIGIRNRLPSGAELSLSYKTVGRTNNLIPQLSNGQFDTEYNAWLNLTLKQPLLRNRGRDVTETDRQVATLEHSITLEQLKQQILKISIEGLTSYWQLYRAEETLSLRKNILSSTEALLADARSRVLAGKLPSTAVLEVQAAMLSRQAEVARSEHVVREAQAKVATALNLGLGSMPAISAKPRLQKRDPVIPEISPQTESVLQLWPAYQIAKLKFNQAKTRLNFAKNQMLPLFDLVLGYSGTGYSYEARNALTTAERIRYPDWYVGVNIEVPLEGNQKATQQFLAQSSRLSQSELELIAIATSFSNDLEVRRSDLLQSHNLLVASHDDVALRKKIFDNEQQRYRLGVGLLGTLIQKQVDLSDSQQRLLENQIRFEIALATLQYAQGNLLNEHQIELVSLTPQLQ
jgi:outer membrane protein TolC